MYAFGLKEYFANANFSPRQLIQISNFLTYGLSVRTAGGTTETSALRSAHLAFLRTGLVNAVFINHVLVDC